jgi:hypothetical protein
MRRHRADKDRDLKMVSIAIMARQELCLANCPDLWQTSINNIYLPGYLRLFGTVSNAVCGIWRDWRIY